MTTAHDRHVSHGAGDATASPASGIPAVIEEHRVPICRLMLVAGLVLGTSHLAEAQDVFRRARPEAAGQERGAMVTRPPRPAPVVQPFSIVSVEPFETAQPVLRAPYSAEAVTEVTQDLADGNRIVNRTSASIMRDSRGRVRREHQAVFVGPLVADREAPLVTIVDPVEGVHVTLDQERRVAFRVPTAPVGADTIEFTTTPLAAAPLPLPPALTTAPTFTIAIAPGMAGGHLAVPGTPPVTTALGDRLIEGVRATGTRTVTTIPAGQIGNQLPIDVVNERWYSPDLQVTVSSRRSDPRFGETLYRLINIVRAEPPADLFEVPPDFRIESPGIPRR